MADGEKGYVNVKENEEMGTNVVGKVRHAESTSEKGIRTKSR